MDRVIKVSRVQERGPITIPIEIRNRLGLESGDFVAFIETETAIVFWPQETLTPEVVNQITQCFVCRLS